MIWAAQWTGIFSLDMTLFDIQINLQFLLRIPELESNPSWTLFSLGSNRTFRRKSVLLKERNLLWKRVVILHCFFLKKKTKRKISGLSSFLGWAHYEYFGFILNYEFAIENIKSLLSRCLKFWCLWDKQHRMLQSWVCKELRMYSNSFCYNEVEQDIPVFSWNMHCGTQQPLELMYR